MSDDVTALINKRVHKVLGVAEAAIPGEKQFEAFRKITLDEFGKNGLLKDLEELDDDKKERDGKGRN